MVSLKESLTNHMIGFDWSVKTINPYNGPKLHLFLGHRSKKSLT
jgi:hypothetical protein